MKVLFLAGMYPTPVYPQKGIFCHEQVRALKARGLDVDVVVPVTFYEKEVKQKEWQLEGVRIRYVRFFKLPRAYDFHRTGKSLFRALKRALKLSEYDVIHADAALPTGYAAMLAYQKYGVPYVVHGHGLDVFLEESYQGYKNCSKIVEACRVAFENASAVIGVSDKVLQRIAKKVDIEGKKFVAFNGVDVERFTPLTHQNDVVKFISVGNLIPLKGHEYIIRSVAALVQTGQDNLHLDIVGRGYLDESLKALVEQLQLSKYVSFYGYIPYDGVRDMMQRSDAFVLPSYFEALGCVYLEAMACGLPVVGCYENGIDEVYENGVQGYLIENKNQEQLTEAMRKLLDEKTRKNMGKRARLLVENNFTWARSADAVEAVYKTVTERR